MKGSRVRATMEWSSYVQMGRIVWRGKKQRQGVWQGMVRLVWTVRRKTCSDEQDGFLGWVCFDQPLHRASLPQCARGVARAWQQRELDCQLFLREKQQDLDPRFAIFYGLVPETTGQFWSRFLGECSVDSTLKIRHCIVLLVAPMGTGRSMASNLLSWGHRSKNTSCRLWSNHVDGFYPVVTLGDLVSTEIP
jgi:hypothetical protein